MQQVFEGRALCQAEKHNHALYQYLNKKIRMYESARKFTKKLAEMEGKKKIE